MAAGVTRTLAWITGLCLTGFFFPQGGGLAVAAEISTDVWAAPAIPGEGLTGAIGAVVAWPDAAELGDEVSVADGDGDGDTESLGDALGLGL
jgi:hypothetical protein